MAENFEGWEKDTNGALKVSPVVGWDLFVPFGMACGLRVHYAREPSDLGSGRLQYLPLILMPAQARELAAALLRTAETAETRPETPGS